MTLIRLHEPESLCVVELDGEKIEVGEGEPLAMALGAQGRMLLSRSVKYHRPRGAVCYSNRCDGCLMRLDGKQSVATCMVRARDGMVCETQNVVGSANSDLLAVTDWFFSDGLDHHHLFTRFGPLNRVMQKIARRIAGVGTLPEKTPEISDVVTTQVDTVIVGAGRSGLAVACALREQGRRVLVLDEREQVTSRASPALERAQHVGADVRFSIAVVGVYERSLLCVPSDGSACEVLEFNDVVFATGTHHNVPALGGVDHPGVITEVAAERLLDEGFLPGKKVLIVCRRPEHGRSLEARLTRAGASVQSCLVGDVDRLRGGHQVDRVELKNGDAHEVDAVVCAGFVSGVYELAVQAGAHARFEDDGFWVEADEAGRVSDSVYAMGHCVAGRSLAQNERELTAMRLATELCGGSR